MWQAYLQDKISDAIGASVVFEKLSISPFRGVADGRGLVARVGDAVTPFLTIERVQLKLKMADLLAKQLTIETVLLERPAVTIERQVDGTWNIPWPKPAPATPVADQPAGSAGTTGSPAPAGWATGVRQVILTDGVVTYRDQSPGFAGYMAEAGPIHLQADQPAPASATLTATVGRLHRLDRPANLGPLQITGQGLTLDRPPDFDTFAGQLTVQVKDRVELNLTRRGEDVVALLAVRLIAADLLPLLPPAWSARVPAWATSLTGQAHFELIRGPGGRLHLRTLSVD